MIFYHDLSLGQSEAGQRTTVSKFLNVKKEATMTRGYNRDTLSKKEALSLAILTIQHSIGQTEDSVMKDELNQVIQHLKTIKKSLPKTSAAERYFNNADLTKT